MIDVAAAILENQEGKILVAKRKQGKKLAGYWELPGGKIEKGESPEVCLVRELQEEMNVKIEVGNYIGEHVHHYDGFTIRLLGFKGRIVGGEIKLEDHDEYVWLKVCDLKKVKLAPADIPIVDLLING